MKIYKYEIESQTYIYELYECDQWRSTDSINVNSRIYLTDNIENIINYVADYITNDEKLNEKYGNFDKYDLFDKVCNQNIEFLHINFLEMGEQ